MGTRPERFLFLLSRVLGGKTFSGHLMHALEGVPGVRPHFVFLEEEDYGRHADKVPAANRISRTFMGPEILKWKLRMAPPDCPGTASALADSSRVARNTPVRASHGEGGAVGDAMLLHQPEHVSCSAVAVLDGLYARQCGAPHPFRR